MLPDSLIPKSLNLKALFEECDGSGVNVAVIDSGMPGSLPFFRECLKRSVVVKKNNRGSFYIEDCPIIESIDHLGGGTSTGACIKSVAPRVNFVSVNFFDAGRAGPDRVGAFLAGLEWALRNNFKLINVGHAFSQTYFVSSMRSLTELAYENQAIIVANGSQLARPVLPAYFSSVLSVIGNGSKVASDYIYLSRSIIEIKACCENNRMLKPNGEVALSSGAQLAAAHITGLVALLLEKYPDLTCPEVKFLLKSMSINCDD